MQAIGWDNPTGGASSNRKRVTWSDGFYAQYDYDALNRVIGVRENGAASGAGVLATYAYDPLSRRQSITRGNGTVATYGYDGASRLTDLTQDLAGTVDDQTFGFGYTAASQVQQRSASNDNYNWTAVSATKSYARNGLNQYTSVSGVAFTYDLRGNLTGDGSRRFCYDLENHLTGVAPASTDPCVSASTLALAYDPLGRLRQTQGAATTQFLHDGDRLSAEYDGAGALLRRYVHGPGVDEPLVWYEGAGTGDRRWLVADHQGSVIAESGAATTRYAYGPYGEPGTWAGSRFRYTGQIALPEAGLYHYKARVYDPVLGRFLQTDPIGYEDGLNWYAYVGNDPGNKTDPSGLNWKQAIERFLARGATKQAFEAARRHAVKEAWKQEQRLVAAGGGSTTSLPAVFELQHTSKKRSETRATEKAKRGVMITDIRIRPEGHFLVVTDDLYADVPELADGLARFWFNRTTLVVGTMVDVDGETRLQVSDQPFATDLPMVFDGVIDTPNGMVTVTDGNLTEFPTVRVSAGKTRVRVWTNDPREPDEILVTIG